MSASERVRFERNDGPVIALSRVHAERDHRVALTDVSLELNRGAASAVVGPNGAGKSTLFAVISKRLRPTSGEVDVRDEVAEVLQTGSIDADLALTVDDVVRMGRYRARGLMRPLRRSDKLAVAEAVDRMRLGDLRRRRIGSLSGGQRQRAMVAQALAQRAPVLLLDEPTTGLDQESFGCIVEAIDEEANAGRAVVYATHDLALARRADTVVALAQSCLCCAPPAVAFAQPDVAELFRAPELRPMTNTDSQVTPT